jgi:hypothetical protein
VLVNDPGNRRKNKYAYKLSIVVAQAKTDSSFMICSELASTKLNHID